MNFPNRHGEQFDYAEYLQSPWWRKRRDLAIRNVGHRCTRCGSKTQVEVHHVSYARLGAELDEDLEVICHDCHEGHHFELGLQDAQLIGVYTRLGSELLKTQRFETHRDFEDAIMVSCESYRIRRDRKLLRYAIERLSPRMFRALPTPQTSTNQEPPMSRDEAKEICRRLGLTVPIRGMPALSDVVKASFRDDDDDG